MNSTIRSLSRRSLFFALVVLALSAASFGQVGISVSFGPPALPVYEQPVCPGDGYLWTPGYWAWDDEAADYYWVPGTWVLAPEAGFLWTPGWWGWGGSAFFFHAGYWGPEVGFYGGINYGFGYFGDGFAGGRWEGGHFFYNRAVMNVNVTEIHNVYNTRVNVNTENHVSYNGGNGGIDRRPTAQEEAAEHQRHIPPVASQVSHVQEARGNRELRASVNQGRPSIAATAKPGEFSGGSVVHAKEAGAPYHPPANRGGAAPGRAAPGRAAEPGRAEEPRGNEHPNTAVHPKELPPMEHPAPANTGNAKQDKKYQQQQEKMNAQQEKERQNLQKKQDQEHQRMTQQHASPERTQQVEQKHQQQTQQMQQRHQAQQQKIQSRQAPPKPKK